MRSILSQDVCEAFVNVQWSFLLNVLGFFVFLILYQITTARVRTIHNLLAQYRLERGTPVLLAIFSYI